MNREQVRQEAELVADSLGLTLDELYHAPLKDILQVTFTFHSHFMNEV